MALSILESIRRLIRQDTVKIGGPVGNLYGAVNSELNLLQASPVQSWLALEVAGSTMPDVETFFQNYGIFGGRMQLMVAQDGSVSIATTQTGRIQLVRTTATIAQRTTMTLRVAVTQPGGECAVYVNGTLMRRGEGVTSVPITLDVGSHDITVVSNATTTTITAPTGVELSGETDLPAPPTWVRVTTNYLDTLVGTAQNTLEWLADPKVGGYYVLRRQRVALQSTEEEASPTDATVLSYGELGADGAYPVVLEGDHATKLTVGSELLAEFTSLGIISQVLPLSGDDTSVRLRLLPGQTLPTADVIGTFTYLGTFSPITQVARTTNASTLVYVDSAVTFGQAYEYALVAYGLVNPAMRSQRSEVVYVVAGDVQPPGSITFLPDYPFVDNGMVTARFTTPDDADYLGVNIYLHELVQNEVAFDQFENYTVAAVSGRTITINDPELPAGALVGYFVRWDNGAEYAVASNTQGTITVSEDMLPAPTVGTSLEIFRNIKIKTDYGVPGTRDEVTFSVETLGRYVFATFDRARNEQKDYEAAYYDVTTLGGGQSAEPIVAFRQLVSGEQSFFPDPFNNTANYAIVELWAANSGMPNNTKFNGVELWYRRRGDLSDRLLFPVPSQQRNFPWIVSGSAQAILDQPDFAAVAPYPVAVSGGVLSRYISLARSQADNWIRVWAENADGLSSDILTFVVDYDNTPEVTSLETSIDNDDDTASFVAIIDDDTQGVRWYVDPAAPGEPTEASPDHLGSTTLKTLRPPQQVSLPLGTSKKLYVTPYATWNTITATVTGVSGRTLTCSGASFPTAAPGMVRYRLTYAALEALDRAPYVVQSNTATTVTVTSDFVSPLPTVGTVLRIRYAAAPAGEQIVRDLVRTPRSFVSFENKNEKGERDVNSVTAVFTQTPAPAIYDGQTFSAAPGPTPPVTLTDVPSLRLTDTRRAWSTNPPQFSSAGSTQWQYLRITGTSGITMVRRIISNNATQLLLEGRLPDGATLAEFAGQAYQIIDGAVWVRKRNSEEGSADSNNFVPTAGRETSRRSATFYLDYYATKNGCLRENIRSIRVDPDTDASFGNFTLTYDTNTRRLTARAETPDDDAKYWELYLRRGSWPTAVEPPTADAALDAKYLRYESSSVNSEALVYTQTVEPGNTWYAIALPYNSFNQPGIRRTASLLTNGSGGTPSALLTLDFRPQANTNTAIVDVTGQSGAQNAVCTVTATDIADPQATVQQTVTLSTLNSAGNYAGSATLTGLPFTVSAVPTTNLRTWTITVTSPPRAPITIQRQFHAVVGAPPPGGNPTVSVPAQAISTYQEGFCPNEGCRDSSYRPLILQVEWTTANANPVLHSVEIDIDIDNSGWVPANWEIAPTNSLQSFAYGFQCYIYRSVGSPVNVYFRVRVVRKDNGATVATATTGAYSTRLFLCQGGTGDI